MKTSSWSRAGTMPGRIGICLYAPRGSLAGFRLYKPLAPTKEMLKMGFDEYTPLYEAILAKLDPAKVAADLQKLAGEHEPILLCYETPSPTFTKTNFCHRRQAAIWLERSLGISVPELGYEGRDVDVKVQPALAL